MNQMHLDLLDTDGWRATLETVYFPFAFGDLAWTDLGDDVLEIGPGPGLTTDLLRSRVAKLTAIELDASLADQLTQRLADTDVTVVEGDATAMPFDDGRFSAAITFTMFHHVPTAALQDRLFAEIFRVLRPGGLLVAHDSLASDGLAAFHVGDVYNPVDPVSLPSRLGDIGYSDVTVETRESSWACRARRSIELHPG